IPGSSPASTRRATARPMAPRPATASLRGVCALGMRSHIQCLSFVGRPHQVPLCGPSRSKGTFRRRRICDTSPLPRAQERVFCMLRRAPSIAEKNAVQLRPGRSREAQRHPSQRANKHSLQTLAPAPVSLTALSRRRLLQFTAACSCAALFPTCPVRAQAQPLATGATMLTRAIPQSQEPLPVVGFGTWQTFDIGNDAQELERRQQVLAVLFGAGGKLIDSSPMYGSAEAVVGQLLAAMQARAKAFLATKVWTRGQAAGVSQMQASLANLQTRSIDLMQIHNLVDWKTHLRTLRAWKEQKRFRYIGITHYTVPELDSLAAIIRDERLDFVQCGYSLNVRAAETRLLPLAAERGAAVIANQPFDSGSLFGKVRG